MSIGTLGEGGNSQGNSSDDTITSNSLKNKIHELASNNDVSIEIMDSIYVYNHPRRQLTISPIHGYFGE